TIPAGTTAIVAGLRVDEPNLTATGTITEAASVYIEAAPTEGGLNFALHVDDGATRLDGQVYIRSATEPVKKIAATTDATAGASTYTIAQMLGGLILRDPAGASRSDVTPTAAAIVAGIVGAAVDDTFETWLVNTADAAEVITVTAGAGVTLIPASITIAQNENAKLLVRLTNVTGASEAVTVYAIVAGG
ncbi:MAG: hypothetical protein Q7R40_14230, partial [Phaeospirillum sp.]|nr:hypothetical protein [Phaeospirillum sp.]